MQLTSKYNSLLSRVSSTRQRKIKENQNGVRTVIPNLDV